jgi:hypothetical protein
MLLLDSRRSAWKKELIIFVGKSEFRQLPNIFAELQKTEDTFPLSNWSTFNPPGDYVKTPSEIPNPPDQHHAAQALS